MAFSSKVVACISPIPPGQFAVQCIIARSIRRCGRRDAICRHLGGNLPLNAVEIYRRIRPPGSFAWINLPKPINYRTFHPPFSPKTPTPVGKNHAGTKAALRRKRPFSTRLVIGLSVRDSASYEPTRQARQNRLLGSKAANGQRSEPHSPSGSDGVLGFPRTKRMPPKIDGGRKLVCCVGHIDR